MSGGNVLIVWSGFRLEIVGPSYAVKSLVSKLLDGPTLYRISLTANTGETVRNSSSQSKYYERKNFWFIHQLGVPLRPRSLASQT